MVARSWSAGLFTGACNATINSCTISELASGTHYEIWVRTCSGWGPLNCLLRAMILQSTTYPSRELPFAFPCASYSTGYKKQSRLILLFSIKAPAAILIKPNTTTSIEVYLTAPEGNYDVDYYEAATGRQICTVKANETPLSCVIENLLAGTRYTVHAFACMPDHECGLRQFAKGYTYPDGKPLM